MSEKCNVNHVPVMLWLNVKPSKFKGTIPQRAVDQVLNDKVIQDYSRLTFLFTVYMCGCFGSCRRVCILVCGQNTPCRALFDVTVCTVPVDVGKKKGMISTIWYWYHCCKPAPHKQSAVYNISNDSHYFDVILRYFDTYCKEQIFTFVSAEL